MVQEATRPEGTDSMRLLVVLGARALADVPHSLRRPAMLQTVVALTLAVATAAAAKITPKANNQSFIAPERRSLGPVDAKDGPALAAAAVYARARELAGTRRVPGCTENSPPCDCSDRSPHPKMFVGEVKRF